MPARVRTEGGFGLIELLVALTVTSIGIIALVAGFSSGYGAINRASRTSTAGALADRQMESFRRGGWDSVQSVAGAPTTGSDGRTYWVESVVASKCPDETMPIGTPPTCTLTGGVQARPVKAATVTVRDGSSTAKLLIIETSTFDQSTG